MEKKKTENLLLTVAFCRLCVCVFGWRFRLFFLLFLLVAGCCLMFHVRWLFLVTMAAAFRCLFETTNNVSSTHNLAATTNDAKLVPDTREKKSSSDHRRPSMCGSTPPQDSHIICARRKYCAGPYSFPPTFVRLHSTIYFMSRSQSSRWRFHHQIHQNNDSQNNFLSHMLCAHDDFYYNSQSV